MNERITMVMSSLNANEEWINRSLQSAMWFDEILLFIDPATIEPPKIDFSGIVSPVRIIESTEHLEIGPAYDLLVEHAFDGWICTFCDDDFFYSDELEKLVGLIKTIDIEEDIIHFRCRVSGPTHPEIIWGNSGVSEELFRVDNQIPAASFFRKEVWESVGGYRGQILHDWIFWFRALKRGFRFRYYDCILYHFTYRSDSAFHQQIRRYAKGGFAECREYVLHEVLRE